MTDHRILVTGSRDWNDSLTVRLTLTRWISMLSLDWEVGDRAVLVHGDCPTGADRIAHALFVEWGSGEGQGLFVIESHPADWTLGPSAGPIRNQEMVNLGAEVCFAFIGPCASPRCKRKDAHPSHGASGTASMAERAGIVTHRIYSENGQDAKETV